MKYTWKQSPVMQSGFTHYSRLPQRILTTQLTESRTLATQLYPSLHGLAIHQKPYSEDWLINTPPIVEYRYDPQWAHIENLQKKEMDSEYVETLENILAQDIPAMENLNWKTTLEKYNTTQDILLEDTMDYLEVQQDFQDRSNNLLCEIAKSLEDSDWEPHESDWEPPETDPFYIEYTYKNGGGSDGGYSVDIGGTLPPSRPRRGFGPGGHDDSGDDALGPVGPFFKVLIYGLLLWCVFWVFRKVYNYLMHRIEKALMELNKYINHIQKKDQLGRVYGAFLKALALLMTFLISGEAFASAISVFSRPILRYFFRFARFGFRGFLLGWFLLGGSHHLMDLYRLLYSFIEPTINKTMSFLAGPPTSTSVLFLEKLLKVILGSSVCGGVVACLQNYRKTKDIDLKNLYFLFAAGLSLSVYFILVDFTYIRQISLTVAEHSLIKPLISCQLGRVTLLIGSSYFIRAIIVLPGSAVFFIIFIYGLGVYSLAISATSNMFPTGR